MNPSILPIQMMKERDQAVVLNCLKNLVKADFVENIESTLEEGQKWVETAIKLIGKKVSSKSQLEVLELAIRMEDRHSPCVTVKRKDDKKKLDKGMTHVLTCRIFRFPWLRSVNDIRNISSCGKGYSRRHDTYCINPYHYDVSHGPPIRPIMVEKNRFKWPEGGIQLPMDVDEYVPNAMLSPDPIASRDLDTEPTSPSSILSEDVDMDAVDERNALTPDYVPSRPGATVEKVPFEEADAWMKISYFEGNACRSNGVDITKSYILIDGFTSSNYTERYSLGYLSGSTSDRRIEETRRLIGKGVRIYYIGGEVYCENLSSNSIFIQAPSCNQRQGWLHTTVSKVPPRCHVKLWNNAEFAELLARAVEQGYEEVYTLSRLCTFRVSFVKGWGANYQRQDVTSTGCWMVAHLNSPLDWVDRVLKSMGAPAKFCTSVS